MGGGSITSNGCYPVTLWLNLQTLHLLYERLHKEQLTGELLADAIGEKVDLNDTVSELIRCHCSEENQTASLSRRRRSAGGVGEPDCLRV
ncbi:MAG: hypothetical protein U0670_23410 [Anaerolineae bacterium]